MSLKPKLIEWVGQPKLTVLVKPVDPLEIHSVSALQSSTVYACFHHNTVHYEVEVKGCSMTDNKDRV